jgi:hypothetical protein
MKKLRLIRFAWVLSLTALALGVSVISPALASDNVTHVTHIAQAARVAQQQSASASLAANIYVTLATLEPQFQAHIDQQVPQSFNSAIATMISKLPPQDQSWALLMATTLISPSATLTGLATRPNGLAMTIQVALYPGDPQPITSTMLVTFSVLNSSTIQVSTSPLSGAALSSGPQQTISIPLGQLTGVNTTPNCGDAALAFHLRIPVSLQQATAPANVMGHANPQVSLKPARASSGGTNTFVEIPAASLAALDGSFGTISMGSGLTAQNISISISDGTIDISSDVYWSGLNIGTAVSTMVPSASGGKLFMQVTSTTFNLFGLFPINESSYDQQIEQTINSKLGSAFAGEFFVNQAQIGPNSHLPCAQSDSLVLSGASSIG